MTEVGEEEDEDDDDDDIIVLEEDDDDEVEAADSAPPPQAPSTQAPPRSHLAPFQFQAAADDPMAMLGDDGIVPSTPTLYIHTPAPDGFAEAISSPQVSEQVPRFGNLVQPPLELPPVSSGNLAYQRGIEDMQMDLAPLSQPEEEQEEEEGAGEEEPQQEEAEPSEEAEPAAEEEEEPGTSQGGDTGPSTSKRKIEPIVWDKTSPTSAAPPQVFMQHPGPAPPVRRPVAPRGARGGPFQQRGPPWGMNVPRGQPLPTRVGRGRNMARRGTPYRHPPF